MIVSILSERPQRHARQTLEPTDAGRQCGGGARHRDPDARNHSGSRFSVKIFFHE